MELTSKERVSLSLDHKNTDRTPFSWGFGIDISVRKSLMDHLGSKSITEVDRYLDRFSDFKNAAPEYIGPKDKNLTDHLGNTIDIWGVKRKLVKHGSGSYDEIYQYPLKDVTETAELEKYDWPLPEWFICDDIEKKIKKINENNEYAIKIGIANIFETSWYMRGFEKMLMDIVIEKELAWEIMTRVTDFYISYFKKMIESANGKIDIVFTADDIGQQQGLLMSYDIWEEMIKPHHLRLNKILHGYGVKVMYHTDGSVMEAVPGLIDMGVDILEALQFDSKGMDPKKLKAGFGDVLCFHGGISVQKTLPFGTSTEVKAEVEDRIKVLGENGGYIIAPSHKIQAGTPPENVIAFLEASKNRCIRSEYE